jgi:hypothetical protein
VESNSTMDTPAGWYPTAEGSLRYWDGRQWTLHVAPSPGSEASPGAGSPSSPSERPAPVRGRRLRVGPAGWFGWGGLCLVALVGAASSGVGGLLTMSGVYVVVVALVALVRGRVRWARLRTRAAGGVALGVAMAVAIGGAATADPPKAPSAAPSSSSTSSPSPSRAAGTVAPRATLTASATPTPSSTPPPSAKPTTSPTPPTPSATRPPSSTPKPPAKPTTSPTRPTVPPASAPRGSALAAVAGLTVKGRAPKSGYVREQFGQPWFDTDRNGCDTRNDILRRDLVDRDMKNACKVLAGTRNPDPYTGKTIRFVIGGASEIDIDHVVPLSDAWQKGAATWAPGKRLAFANDPLNLLAVDAGANRSKGGGDVATWLPPNKSYRCAYVARVASVKAKYRVWVTPAERDAMVRVLSKCAGTPLPAAGPAPTTAAMPKRSRKAAPAPTPPRAPKPKAPSNVYYENCTAVRAAGAAPIAAGDDGYSFKLDRDRDGIACE